MRITRQQLRQLITESFAGSQFRDDEGRSFSVADGLNRMYKAVNVLGVAHIDIYLVPKEDILGLEL